MALRMRQWDCNREKIVWGIYLLLVALLVGFPFLSVNHVIDGFDIEFHLGRIAGISEGLLSGQFPVRVNPLQLDGYGMPTGIFYPDLLLYFPAILHIMGVSLLACWKIMFITIDIVTAFICWWAFSTYARSYRIGAIASSFYLIGFLRMYTMYIGTSVPTVLAMAFFPAAITAIWITLHRDTSRWPLVVLFSVPIFLTHVIMSLLLIGMALFMVAASFRHFFHREVWQAAAKAAGFTALLTLWVYAPLLYFHRHMDYMMKQGVHRGVWDNFIFPFPQFNFYVGSSMLVLITGLSVCMFLHRKHENMKMFLILVLASVGFLLLMRWPYPWHHALSWLGGVLQFPARLAVFPAIFLSLAAAIALESVGLACAGKRWAVWVMTVVVCGCNFFWLFGYDYTFPLQMRQGDILPHWHRMTNTAYLEHMNQGYSSVKDYMEVATFHRMEEKPPEERGMTTLKETSSDTRIENVVRRGNDFVFQYVSGESEWVQLPIFWYMGYVARDVQGQLSPLRKDEDGQVSVFLPPASGRLHVFYEGLPWFHVTDLISWFSLFVFLYMVARMWKQKKNE